MQNFTDNVRVTVNISIGGNRLLHNFNATQTYGQLKMSIKKR